MMPNDTTKKRKPRKPLEPLTPRLLPDADVELATDHESPLVHILIKNPPDWWVAMCGHALALDYNVLPAAKTTVGRLCWECLTTIVRVHSYDLEDAEQRRIDVDWRAKRLES